MRRVRAFAATKMLASPGRTASFAIFALRRCRDLDGSSVRVSAYPSAVTAPGMATRRARASRYFSSEARWTGLARSWNIGDAWEQQAVDGIRQRFVLRWFNLSGC